MTILVTGVAGFIGSATARALLARGETVVGLDNLNAYYTPALKRARLDQFASTPNFRFIKSDIADPGALSAALTGVEFQSIIHLAAQAGVRYSLTNPFAYSASNLTGHLAILELARQRSVKHVVYASSSSIYGANEKVPFCENDVTDAPVSLYGATKKSNELMSSSYARLYALPQTGLRFFTVYGPWGRPDMAYWIFTEKMLKGEPIEIFNNGDMGRDFTFIDDIVDGVVSAHDAPPGADETFHRVFNLGNDRPEGLMDMIALLEQALGVKADKVFKPMQKGDVQRTWADISKARRLIGYDPKTSLADGLAAFAKWRRETNGSFF
ncbi:MAG: NAD-dependent epimerase/dehydratase family protein [Pseudomonadota bacterium]